MISKGYSHRLHEFNLFAVCNFHRLIHNITTYLRPRQYIFLDIPSSFFILDIRPLLLFSCSQAQNTNLIRPLTRRYWCFYCHRCWKGETGVSSALSRIRDTDANFPSAFSHRRKNVQVFPVQLGCFFSTFFQLSNTFFQ